MTLMQDASLVLKDELVFDRLAGFSLRTKYDSLKKDTAEVEAHVRQLMECLESLTRLQQRYANIQIHICASPVLNLSRAIQPSPEKNWQTNTLPLT